MRIACPSCKATYEVPDALLGATARKVRCARCANEWTPEAPAIAQAPLPLPPPEREPPPPVRPVATRALAVPRVEGKPVSSQRRPPAQGGVMGRVAVLGLSVVALAAMLGAAYVWRGELMLVWPPSQRLFAALGLA
jgi:predicted Zn finger-like uncharacterized protein